MGIIKDAEMETKISINGLVARISGYCSNYFKPTTCTNDVNDTKNIKAIVEAAKELEKEIIKRDTLYFAKKVEESLEYKLMEERKNDTKEAAIHTGSIQKQ